MRRRRFCALALTTVGLGGCIRGESGVGGGSTATETGTDTETTTATDTPTATSTPSPTASPAEPGCWPEMCAGTTIVEVTVSSQFEGTVVLSLGCRSDDRTVPVGETVIVERETESESCAVDLTVDGTTVYEADIPGYQRTTVRVGVDGSVEKTVVVL